MRRKISEDLQAESVEITDTYGDGRHVSINVVSSAFEGQSSMKRWACFGKVSVLLDASQVPSNVSLYSQYAFTLPCRQRMVYKAIWLELQDTVHAVDSMQTKTPEEAGQT